MIMKELDDDDFEVKNNEMTNKLTEVIDKQSKQEKQIEQIIDGGNIEITKLVELENKELKENISIANEATKDLKTSITKYETAVIKSRRTSEINQNDIENANIMSDVEVEYRDTTDTFNTSPNSKITKKKAIKFNEELKNIYAKLGEIELKYEDYLRNDDFIL